MLLVTPKRYVESSTPQEDKWQLAKTGKRLDNET